MTSHASGAHASTAASADTSTLVSGRIAFAAVMMIFGGLMNLFSGIAAIAQDEVFIATRNYVFEFNLTGWGWAHLVLGVLLAVTGLALFSGAAWARVVGVALAGLGMLANFMWLPYFPLWALVVLTVDGFIIWALCTGAPSRSPAM